MHDPTTFRIMPAAAALLLAVSAGLTRGQPANEPPAPVQPLEPAAPQPIDPNEPIQPTTSKPPLQTIPSVPAPVADAPGLSVVDFSLPVRRLYTEGTFIPSRAGRLIRARTGDVIFLPDTPADAPAEPPMVLLASQRLGQIENAMSAPGFTGYVSVGGQVFVYRNRHYLLPSVFAPQSAPAAAPPPPEPAKAEPATPAAPPTDPAADPRVEDLIKDLESQRAVPRALAPNPVPDPKPHVVNEPRPADTSPLTPEGTLLVFKRGRLVRLKDNAGRIAFAFDNDANSPAPAPMLIEPCAQLQRLEALVAARGDAMPLKVSGRVLTYHGRNYLLPTFVQVASTSEVVPMQ